MADGKITLETGLISAGFGVVDIGMRELDFSQGWDKKQINATNVARAGTAVGSLIGNYATKNKSSMVGQATETLFYSSLPLFEDTLYVLAKNAFQGTTISNVAPPGQSAPTSAPTASDGGTAKTY